MTSFESLFLDLGLILALELSGCYSKLKVKIQLGIRQTQLLTPFCFCPSRAASLQLKIWLVWVVDHDTLVTTLSLKVDFTKFQPSSYNCFAQDLSCHVINIEYGL